MNFHMDFPHRLICAYRTPMWIIHVDFNNNPYNVE
jgi:hypothetical protein